MPPVRYLEMLSITQVKDIFHSRCCVSVFLLHGFSSFIHSDLCDFPPTQFFLPPFNSSSHVEFPHFPPRLLDYQQDRVALEWIIDSIFSSTWAVWFDSHTFFLRIFLKHRYLISGSNWTALGEKKMILISRNICRDLWLFCWLEYEGVHIKLHFKEVCCKIH